MSDTEFPYSLTISLPLPTTRLALSALRTLEVDTELSPFVRRDLTITSPSSPKSESELDPEAPAVLETTYRATTNRMLRVAVNGFMESLGVILGVMEELDVDVLEAEEDEEKK
ncbi:hypothetical protein N8T08_002430 [Aspergillus melleus]|uniref:Uncharacterized protein n=1 Tax=Aspergillus melleus TaxID=138277 RepID=A0ACC3AM67_9EURO|nr:hypothetical protein N8T08_002430 [Aspergillus melleus]